MNKNISKKKLKEFGYLIGFAFPFIIGWILPKLLGHPFRVWTIWISAPFLILGTIRSNLLYFPYRLWMLIGYILGWINSRIILGLIFLLILFPISLIMGFFGYDPLRKKHNNQVSHKEKKKLHKIDLTRIF